MKETQISHIDTMFVNGSYPIEFLLFYPEQLDSSKIRAALKKTAPLFWPIFGEYQNGHIYFEEYSENDCLDEQRLTEAFNANATLQELHQEYHSLIPTDIEKLFFLKIIHFNNGTVLIPKMNHLSGDGYSYFYFLSALAGVSRDGIVPLRSLLYRTLFKPKHTRIGVQYSHNTEADLDSSTPKDSNLTIEYKEISKQTLSDHINEIASEYEQTVSPNDVLSAMVLKETIERQFDQFGHTVELTIPVDIRGKVTNIVATFFGNGLMFNVIPFEREKVQQLSVRELALEIRKWRPRIDTNHYVCYLEKFENLINEGQLDRLRPWDPQTGVLVTNLSKLPTNKLDFGTGNPSILFPLTIAKNSAVVLRKNDMFTIRLVY